MMVDLLCWILQPDKYRSSNLVSRLLDVKVERLVLSPILISTITDTHLRIKRELKRKSYN